MGGVGVVEGLRGLGSGWTGRVGSLDPFIDPVRLAGLVFAGAGGPFAAYEMRNGLVHFNEFCIQIHRVRRNINRVLNSSYQNMELLL